MITRQTIIAECIMKYPRTAEYLIGIGFHCVGCFAANMETIEQGLRVHGKSEKEIDEIVKKLNEIAKDE